MRSIEQQGEVRWPEATVLSALYVLLYVLLDRVSFILALQHTEVSPWGPNIALMIAVVMRYGVRVAPLTLLAPGISEIVLRNAAPLGAAPAAVDRIAPSIYFG
jgi:integral membrane sensor domain MASE1